MEAVHAIGDCRRQKSFRPGLELLRCAMLHEQHLGRQMKMAIEHSRRAGGEFQGLSQGELISLQYAMIDPREHPEEVAQSDG
jgi:hypothetical protein